jgi:hypothetical protein
MQGFVPQPEALVVDHASHDDLRQTRSHRLM